MGKYSEVLKKLSAMPVENPSWQAKVTEAKEKMPKGVSELVQIYTEYRRKKDEIDDELSLLNIQIEATKQMIINIYEEEGITSLKLENGKSVRVQPEPKAKVEDKEKFRLWCIADGLENSLALPWQTTNALTKERLLNGQPEPDGVKAFIYDKIVLTGGKK